MHNGLNLLEAPSKSMEEHAHKVKNVDESFEVQTSQKM